MNLERDIGKILQKLENIEEWMKDKTSKDKEVEQRVVHIEKRNNIVAGGVAVVFFFWTVTSDFLLRAIGLKT